MIQAELHLRTETLPVREFSQWNENGVALWWLGQAGFLLRRGKTTIIIDAYLSDVLAQKYKGEKFPHVRMMPSPLGLEELKGIDYCLSSHAHSDHLDPGMIPYLRDASPECRFIVPEAVRDVALSRAVPDERLTGLDAGDTLSLGSGLSLTAIPAAHEELKQDDKGHHFFLGYVLDLDGYTIFHPGDCLPYKDFNTWLKPFNIDLALLPVNGQRDELSREGIAGNFSARQACQIMKEHGISYMIPQHYGMFEFNTVDPESLQAVIDSSGMADRIFPAHTGVMYHLIRK